MFSLAFVSRNHDYFSMNMSTVTAVVVVTGNGNGNGVCASFFSITVNDDMHVVISSDFPDDFFFVCF